SSVHFDLYSPDVIHSFWIPELGFKMDVVPGRDNAFQADINGDTEGHYIGRCAELRGVDHSRKLFNVKVMLPAELHEWAPRQEQDAAAAGEADEPADLEEIEEIDE